MKHLVKQKQEAGHQVILLADMNEDVTSDRITQWAEDSGIYEVVSTTTNKVIPTSQRGSTPIDGIFLSHSLTQTQAGYFPFGTFHSDHRALWVDIDHNQIFGFKQIKHHSVSARRLQSQVPSVRNKWIRHYKNFLIQNKLISRQIQLEHDLLTKPATEQMRKKFEKILQQRQEGIAYADNKCRKLKCGNVPYTPQLAQASQKIRVWKAAQTIKTGCKFSSRLFRRLEKQVGLKNCLHKSIKELKQEETTAWKEYWKTKKQAHSLRKTFLTQKAEDIAEESNTQTLATVYKQLITRERQREDARKIKSTLKKLQKMAVTTVEVTDEQGNVHEISDKNQIELECIKENDCKYTQTSNTVCMKEPLRSLLGKTGNTSFCDTILDGTAVLPQNIPPYTREFLQQLKRSPHAAKYQIPHHISENDFKEGWKVMKESTSSSSLTGLHFGHLKTCAMDPTLTKFESSVANVPYVSGIPPRQWQESVIVMIKKKVNLNNILALRSVVLTEADFNFNNKILGRRTLQHAEAINEIAPEQYGSRKKKSAIDQALHKKITYDIIRQTKLPGALCSNDAKSCYDRVLHSIASLAYRRLGVPNPPVQCMLESIQNMSHHIKTSFGISTITLSKKNTLIPFQGILQGNGASPTTWIIISTPLLNMLRAAGHGAKFKSPISHENTHIVGFAYVDDTDLITYNMTDENISWETVGAEMQEAINRWEGGLKSTGGAIVPHKSWVYPLDFVFDNTGEAHYKNPADINQEFTVLDNNDIRNNLQVIKAAEGKETLGVILAPDGNTEDAFKELCNKAKKWKACIKAGHLTPSLVWQALQTTIMKSLEYPLPALTLSQDQCNKIMGIIKDGLLSSSSISRNIPSPTLYGPKEDGGLQLNHLYITQGLLHLEKFIQHIASPSITGKLIRVSLELSQLEVGIGRNIFSLDYNSFHFLIEDSWIKTLWKFVDEHKIQLTPRNINLPLPQQEGDLFLTEAFQAQGYSKKEQVILNRCRMYLRVLTVADVMTGSGDSFTEAYLGQKEQQPRNNYIWPRQELPTLKMIKLWRKALKKDIWSQRWYYRVQIRRMDAQRF